MTPEERSKIDDDRLIAWFAGADSTPRDPATTSSVGQIWYYLLTKCTEEQRLDWLQRAIEAHEVAHRCFAMNHERRIEDAEKQLRILRP